MSKFCLKCKTETVRNKWNRCMPCARISSALWRANNPEKAKSIVAAWVVANPDKEKKRRISYYAANKEKIKTANSTWKANNSDKQKITKATWLIKNIDARRVYEHNRRAIKRTNGGKLSKGLTERLFKLQKGKCACCKKPLGNDFHMDHIMPLALGGANADWNMQLLTATCNHQKHAKHPIDFMQERGFLV